MYKNSIIALAILIFVGCGIKETTVQSRDIAYIQINKTDSLYYKLVVDDKEYEIADTKYKLYKINSGIKEIKIYDSNNNLIHQEKKYIGENNTVEISIP